MPRSLRALLLAVLLLSVPLRLGGCYAGPRVIQGPLIDCRVEVCPR